MRGGRARGCASGHARGLEWIGPADYLRWRRHQPDQRVHVGRRHIRCTGSLCQQFGFIFNDFGVDFGLCVGLILDDLWVTFDDWWVIVDDLWGNI